jgi:hypothetical protein
MSQFRSRPSIIEAVQFHGPHSIPEGQPFPESPPGVGWKHSTGTAGKLFPFVTTGLGQDLWVNPGDWIISELGGSYPCDPKSFAELYEAIQ